MNRGRRSLGRNVAGRIGRRLQHRTLQRPRRRRVVIADAHLEIDRVHLLILKDSEIRQAAAAACSGGDGYAARGLISWTESGLG